MNNEERRQWVLNDEGLYNWWQRSRLPLREFIRTHKEQIDDVINNVTGGTRRAHYLEYDVLPRKVRDNPNPRQWCRTCGALLGPDGVCPYEGEDGHYVHPPQPEYTRRNPFRSEYHHDRRYTYLEPGDVLIVWDPDTRQQIGPAHATIGDARAAAWRALTGTSRREVEILASRGDETIRVERYSTGAAPIQKNPAIPRRMCGNCRFFERLGPVVEDEEGAMRFDLGSCRRFPAGEELPEVSLLEHACGEYRPATRLQAKAKAHRRALAKPFWKIEE